MQLFIMSEEILKKIASDVAVVKEKVKAIEFELTEISNDLHEIRPDYVEKLKRIEKEGTISKGEFENKFGVKI